MEFPSEFPLAKHTRKRIIHLTNGFPLPNSKRLSLGRVPSRDKRSRGRRFHRRNHLFILLGRDREGLLRLSIVHRLGVLPGTFLKMRSLCFFVSLRDARLSNNIREMMMRKFAHVSSRVRVLAKSGCDGLNTTTLDAHSFARGV